MGTEIDGKHRLEFLTKYTASAVMHTTDYTPQNLRQDLLAVRARRPVFCLWRLEVMMHDGCISLCKEHCHSDVDENAALFRQETVFGTL